MQTLPYDRHDGSVTTVDRVRNARIWDSPPYPAIMA
jgi:hypothetical protein